MDSYPRCATCKHWHADPNNGGHWGICALTVTDTHDCTMRGPDTSKAWAHVILPDESDQHERAALYTESDFGCVQHEPKES